MTVFLVTAVLSILLALLFKAALRWTISWTECGLQVGIGLAIGLLFSLFTIDFPEHDTEVLNGQIIEKVVDKRSCSHSYDCNPYQHCTTTNGKTTCVTRYRTCYEHNADYDWDLRTGVGTFTIDRIDRQGKKEPPRWTAAKVGDPVSRAHSYISYIKTRPETLFNQSDNAILIDRFAGKIPQYPLRVYDYYKVDRLVQAGITVPDAAEWNRRISEFLKIRGHSKQVNLVPIFTNVDSPEFANAISSVWLGGKKNDVITVIGFSEYPKIDWVDIISWTDSNLFKVEARDALLDMKTLTMDDYFKVMGDAIDKNYLRKSQKDFKFLMDARSGDDLTVLLIAVLVTLIANIAAGVYFHKNEL